MKKTLTFVLFLNLITTLGLLAGCEKVLRITDFDGLKDLPRNPSSIVFATNSNTFDEENGWGNPIEYALESEKVFEVADKLFALRYEAYPENVEIDLLPIVRYLVFYNDDGDTWIVYLGIRRHKERWYYPIDDNDLITLLYESIVEGSL